MTIGPDPMISIFLMSVRFGIAELFAAMFLHHVEKLFEQVVRVMRTRRRFRMVLNAERRNRAMLEAFAGVVVQVDMRDLDVVQIETFRVDREAVILRGDLHLFALDIKNRMITAVMSEFQLVGFAAQSQSENLMAQTNPEDRLLPQHVANALDRVLERLRVARPIR